VAYLRPGARHEGKHCDHCRRNHDELRIGNLSVGRAGAGDNLPGLARGANPPNLRRPLDNKSKFTQKPALFHLQYDSKRHDFFSLPCVAAKKRECARGVARCRRSMNIRSLALLCSFARRGSRARAPLLCRLGCSDHPRRLHVCRELFSVGS